MDEEEVEKSFWFSRPDDWVVNRKMKKIILLEFKRATTHTHYNGSVDARDRSRMGGRGCPAGHRTTVSQRRGAAGILQVLRDR